MATIAPPEPDDADDQAGHVPADLVELYEVLEWEKAVAVEVAETLGRTNLSDITGGAASI